MEKDTSTKLPAFFSSTFTFLDQCPWTDRGGSSTPNPLNGPSLNLPRHFLSLPILTRHTSDTRDSEVRGVWTTHGVTTLVTGSSIIGFTNPQVSQVERVDYGRTYLSSGDPSPRPLCGRKDLSENFEVDQRKGGGWW